MLKRKIFKRYKTGRKKGGQRYHVTIDKNTRQIFNATGKIGRKKREYGGWIDFKKGGDVERFVSYKGTPEEVYYPSKDYEVEWHSHPSRDAELIPSIEDMSIFAGNNDAKAQIIFRGGKALIMKKRKNSSEWLQKNKPSLIEYDKANSSKYDDLVKKGFIISLNKRPASDIKINIKPVETHRLNFGSFQIKKGDWIMFRDMANERLKELDKLLKKETNEEYIADLKQEIRGKKEDIHRYTKNIEDADKQPKGDIIF